jgi:hypothetical protein
MNEFDGDDYTVAIRMANQHSGQTGESPACDLDFLSNGQLPIGLELMQGKARAQGFNLELR